MTDSPATGSGTVTVELFGMPRVLTGTDHIATEGNTLYEVLQSLVDTRPDLGAHVLRAGGDWLNAGYTFIVDGRFTDDASMPVASGSEILLVSRASGG